MNTMTTQEIKDCAISLYDGGWRPSDADEIVEEYGITQEQAEEICEAMEDFIEKVFAPVTDALAVCKEKYSLADIDSPSEAQAILEEIDGICKGLIIPSDGKGFGAFADAKVDWDAAWGIEATDLREVVKDVALSLDQVIEMLDEAIPQDERILTTTKRIRRSGNSLMVAVTDEAGMLGLGQGDIVEITLRRV